MGKTTKGTIIIRKRTLNLDAHHENSRGNKKEKSRIEFSIQKLNLLLFLCGLKVYPKIHIRVTHNFTVSPTLFLTNCVNTQNDFCDMFFLSD